MNNNRKDNATVLAGNSSAAELPVRITTLDDNREDDDDQFVDIELNDPKQAETALTDDDESSTEDDSTIITATRTKKCIVVSLSLKLLVLIGISLVGLVLGAGQRGNNGNDQQSDNDADAANAVGNYRVQVLLRTTHGVGGDDDGGNISRRGRASSGLEFQTLDQMLAVGDTYTTPSGDISVTLDSVVEELATVSMVVSGSTNADFDASPEDEQKGLLCQQRSWEVTRQVYHQEEGAISNNDVAFSPWSFQPSCQIGSFYQIRVRVSSSTDTISIAGAN